MSYQPNLFIRNIGNVCANKVHELVSNFQFGKISAVELIHKKKETSAIIKMEHWNTRRTQCTRIMLSQGKPILLYHTDDKFWQVYAYNESAPLRVEKNMVERKVKNVKKYEKNVKKQVAPVPVEQIKKQVVVEEVNDWDEFNKEYERKQVVLDYGDIPKVYKGDTVATRKLQQKLMKYKVKV